MTSLLCPLDPYEIRQWENPMSDHHLEEIEAHISSRNCFHSTVLKELVFHHSLEGCTPLILACHFGELASVKRIVENWGVDVRACAVYYIDPIYISEYALHSTRIEVATPLFVAAIRGHGDIVRYLVEKGADVSAKTFSVKEKHYDGLTPLYGALCKIRRENKGQLLPVINIKERSDIIRFLLKSGADTSSLSNGKPIWMMPLCGIDAITELVNHGMDLNHRTLSENGTILSYWVSWPHNQTEIGTEEDSLVVVKLLIEKGVHLLAHRDEWGFTPIIEAAYGRNGVRPNYTVLDYLLERTDISLMDKIEALELAGAVTLRSDEPDHQKAFKYWRQALHLRQMVPKPLLKFKNVRTIEWATSDDLERLFHHPSEYEIQSFLVRLRILFSRKQSWRAVQSLFQFYITDMSFANLEGQKRYDDILDIVWAMLETIGHFNDLKESGLIKWMTARVVKKLVEMLSSLEVYYSDESIKTSLDLVLPHLDDYWKLLNTTDYMRTMLQLTTLLSGKQQMLEEVRLESFFQLVRRERCDEKGQTLLLIACEDVKNTKLYATVQLLLNAKADPNVADKHGNAPLHAVVKLKGELGDSLARLLVNSGAHLDQVNKFGKAAVDVWMEKNRRKRLRTGDQRTADLPDWSRGIVHKLSCWAARTIRLNSIPYLNKVPATLNLFVKMH